MADAETILMYQFDFFGDSIEFRPLNVSKMIDSAQKFKRDRDITFNKYVIGK